MPHKLLLADDSVTIQRVIELTFADEDIQVVAVGNGQDAIDRVLSDRPDIILADVGMPARNGYEVAAFVKANSETAHIPVVLLTGAFEPIDEALARSVGCDGVLVKPFEPQMVISRVKDLLAGRAPAGMWGAAPAAQGPVRPAPSDFDLLPIDPTAESGDPLEAYFDRLDAAFALNALPAAQDAPAPQEPSAPAAQEPATPAVPVATESFAQAQTAPSAPVPDAPPAPSEPPVQVQGVTSAPVDPAAGVPLSPGDRPSLVEAFAALLAAEQKMALAPSGAPVAPALQQGDVDATAIPDALVEAVSARVLARLAGGSRGTILDLAERLVREEIDRIKQHS